MSLHHQCCSQRSNITKYWSWCFSSSFVKNGVDHYNLCAMMMIGGAVLLYCVVCSWQLHFVEIFVYSFFLLGNRSSRMHWYYCCGGDVDNKNQKHKLDISPCNCKKRSGGERRRRKGRWELDEREELLLAVDPTLSVFDAGTSFRVSIVRVECK